MTTSKDLPDLEPLLVRVKDAARLLGLGPSKVYELLDAGDIPWVKVGSARCIALDDLRAWIDKHKRHGR